ncbi:MAG TPA: hypothetical protein VH350_04470 [Candidatus Sulfotelmatobacter sp.]|jgi:hypothetical protein|nr:hypothetical protein [Candidatus Sulfotelmatobacter sp.]
MNDQINTRQRISPGRLWFGFAGSAASWIALGIIDLLITWQACLGKEQYGGAHIEPGFRIIYLIFTLALLITAVVAGAISFRNWRELSRERDLSNAEGRGRQEYMALAGVFISATLGIGIIWLGLPLLIIDLCVRAR